MQLCCVYRRHYCAPTFPTPKPNSNIIHYRPTLNNSVLIGKHCSKRFVFAYRLFSSWDMTVAFRLALLSLIGFKAFRHRRFVRENIFYYYLDNRVLSLGVWCMSVGGRLTAQDVSYIWGSSFRRRAETNYWWYSGAWQWRGSNILCVKPCVATTYSDHSNH